MATQAPTRPVSDKQGEFIEALRTRLFRYLLFGGGTGGGKSWLGAQLFVNLAMNQPGTSYGVFRKNLTTLKRTTYRTFLKYARQHNIREGVDYTVNKESGITWTFTNGSTIDFMELDITKDPEMNKLGGLELTAAMIDEADEVAEQAFNTLRFRIGRNNFSNEFAFIYLTCNPNQTWVKHMFYDQAKKRQLREPFYFLESLITDNPYQSEQALAAAADPTAPAQYVERYFRGNWEYINDPNALFPNRVIDFSLALHVPKVGTKTIGVDVSREGNDKTVFALVQDNMLIDLFEPDIDRADDQDITGQIGDALILYMNDNSVGAQFVWVDGGGGYGGGVIDHLRSKGYFVNTWQSGASPTKKHPDGTPKYDMMRSQRYWEVAHAMATGTFKIWGEVPNLEELRKDLLAHTFSTDDKKTVIESKKTMKKRLGRSPDWSDALVMAYHDQNLHNDDSVTTVGGYYDDYDENN